jgi:Na+(H+)/acetate symporter ActP
MFWKRATHAGVMAAAVMGLVGIVGGFIYECNVLKGKDDPPGWLQASYSYNCVALGVTQCHCSPGGAG